MSNNSLRSIHCEFSNPDLFNITYGGYGDQYWTGAVELETKKEIGKSTVTVTDQAGNSFAFEIQVSKQQFPQKLKNSKGKEVADGKSYLSHIDLSETFSFSDAVYMGDWSQTNSTEFSLEPVDGGRSAKITYIGSSADKYDSIGKSTEVTVYDEDHINSITFTLAVGLDLDGLEVYSPGFFDYDGDWSYISSDSRPSVKCYFREKQSEKRVPRFDESIVIETGSTQVFSGLMRLELFDRNESEGTFVLKGTADLSDGFKTGVGFNCADYFGHNCGGVIWW